MFENEDISPIILGKINNEEFFVSKIAYNEIVVE